MPDQPNTIPLAAVNAACQSWHGLDAWDQMTQAGRESQRGWMRHALTSALPFLITDDTSDGYHTFREYFHQRMLYNAALFSHWASHDPYGPAHHDVHKSRLHDDGTHPFGKPEWFVVRAQLPTGQISNHYLIDDAWDLFKVPEWERAAKWDGHTAAEAETRLLEYVRSGA